MRKMGLVEDGSRIRVVFNDVRDGVGGAAEAGDVQIVWGRGYLHHAMPTKTPDEVSTLLREEEERINGHGPSFSLVPKD